MKLSLTVMLVLKDALIGSLAIRGSDLFTYTREAREKALEQILKMLDSITLDIEVIPEESSEEG